MSVPVVQSRTVASQLAQRETLKRSTFPLRFLFSVVKLIAGTKQYISVVNDCILCLC